jgi:transposase InsO family protein
MMVEDSLLAVRRRKFIVTTESGHALPVYRNLAAHLEVTGINQLWVADMTYIRLRKQFLYLAVVLDAFSRRVVGWALDDSLHAPLVLAALRRALEERNPRAGLVHHSDRGIQYASREYIILLEEHGIEPSMSRAGNPYDNAKCESFIKTLKQEEIYTRDYRDRADLELHIAEFIEQYYNRRRLHSALDYRSPERFEHSLLTKAQQIPAAQMEFFGGMRESIAPMQVRTGRSRKLLPPHRRDEFQLSIPWRVALQQSSPLLPQPPSTLQPQPPVRPAMLSERQPGTFCTVSTQGVTP